jgi:hypothetical protein
MMNKKGQGLSLNVIIIAALALIVLVVLIMVFTGRIGIFQSGLDKEGQTELVTMKITYGQCKPSVAQESSFTSQFAGSESVTDQEAAKTTFREEISRCKSLNVDKVGCEGGGCRWG